MLSCPIQFEQSLASYRKGVEIAEKYLGPTHAITVTLRNSSIAAKRAIVNKGKPQPSEWIKLGGNGTSSMRHSSFFGCVSLILLLFFMPFTGRTSGEAVRKVGPPGSSSSPNHTKKQVAKLPAIGKNNNNSPPRKQEALVKSSNQPLPE